MSSFQLVHTAPKAQYLLPVSLVWARYAALPVLRASFASRASARAKAPTIHLGQPLGPWEHYSALGTNAATGCEVYFVELRGAA